MKISSLLVGVALLAGSVCGQAADPSSPLFDSHAVLELTMPIDFDALCNPGEDEGCVATPTVLEYTDASGATVSMPISVRRRDGWRAQDTSCQIPTMFVEFSPESTIGTPFEGQTSLALTSHCGKALPASQSAGFTLPNEFERYVINEYLGYRLYNLVTDASLQVRLARIHYVDPGNPRRAFTRDAFFAEHFDALAARLDAERVPVSLLDPQRLDWQRMDELALFQFMIGNTDWSLESLDNILLLQMADGRQVPVLFDLDMSGLVNAHYAKPKDGLPVSAVTQRYFMGYCHDGVDWDALFAKFSALDANTMKMLVDTPGLGRGDRRATALFLDTFFEILDTSDSREQFIRDACRPMPALSGGMNPASDSNG